MSKLKKSLGFIDGVALLVGITIGAGIFKTPQVISRYIDSFFLIIFEILYIYFLTKQTL